MYLPEWPSLMNTLCLATPAELTVCKKNNSQSISWNTSKRFAKL